MTSNQSIQTIVTIVKKYCWMKSKYLNIDAVVSDIEKLLTKFVSKNSDKLNENNSLKKLHKLSYKWDIVGDVHKILFCIKQNIIDQIECNIYEINDTDIDVRKDICKLIYYNYLNKPISDNDNSSDDENDNDNSSDDE